jgi:hypothetical protein
MIKLHYYPSTAAMVPHILLEELGVQAPGLPAAEPERAFAGVTGW